tara:strand:+ start:1551 stop:2099 length:549 start_codon:yes stop_codon:yes gene_type:complete
MSNSHISYLELIIGPMFSGKTTRLINIYNEKIAEGRKVQVINYSGDTRYHNSMLSTHDKLMIPCVFSNTIKEVCKEPEIHALDIILINEGQFFPDLYDSVITLVETHRKEVYVCGLDGDFKRCKFGGLLDLIPMSDNIIKLHAKCEKCNKNAIFSKRLTNEEQQVLIGSSNYVPVCRDCYNN